MIGMIVVSFSSIALPLLSGLWLAPGDTSPMRVEQEERQPAFAWLGNNANSDGSEELVSCRA